MENVLLDRRSSGSFELPKTMSIGRCRRGLGGTRAAAPRGAYNRSYPTPPYHQQHKAGGAWSSAPVAVPYAARPPIYSSPSLPLLPSNQPPLLPFPPTAAKYATFPFLPAPPPPPPPRAAMSAAAIDTVPAAVPAAARQRDRRRRPMRPTPPSAEPTKADKKKKPLERATPLPPVPVVNEALDDLEQEVARNFVQDLLHALAPPPSSLPLPRFSLVAKASPDKVVAPAAPSCNVEAAAADGIRGLLRL